MVHMQSGVLHSTHAMKLARCLAGGKRSTTVGSSASNRELIAAHVRGLLPYDETCHVLLPWYCGLLWSTLFFHVYSIQNWGYSAFRSGGVRDLHAPIRTSDLHIGHAS